MDAYEWRVTWTKDGHSRTQKRTFQRRYNLDAHVNWLKENAYRIVAIEQRPVGEWETSP